MSKAFGVVGGIVAGKQIIIDWIKQRGRPFLFSSAMTIPDAAACLEAVDLLESSDDLVQRLWQNSDLMKQEMQALGFDIGSSTTPIIPLMLGEAALAARRRWRRNSAVSYSRMASLPWRLLSPPSRKGKPAFVS